MNWYRITYWLGEDPDYPGQNDEPEPYIHADIQYITYGPTNDSVLYTACDGGISMSPDDGFSWVDITNNLSIAQQTNIALSATTEGVFFTGLQDIGTVKYTNGDLKNNQRR